MNRDEEEPPFPWAGAIVSIVFWFAVVAVCFLCTKLIRP